MAAAHACKKAAWRGAVRVTPLQQRETGAHQQTIPVPWDVSAQALACLHLLACNNICSSMPEACTCT